MRVSIVLALVTGTLLPAIAAAQPVPAALEPQISVDQVICRYASSCTAKQDNDDALDLRGLQRVHKPDAKADTSSASGVSANDLLVSFDHGSADLTVQARANLSSFATALAVAPLDIMRFEVAGHTNAVGSARINLDLSQRRAAAARAYLVDNGVDAARLTAKGYGFSRPLAAKDARAPENRRVELVPVTMSAAP